MAGVSVDSGGKGGRRSVGREINMIPMIDLMVCCISFLLITAVWSHMSRMNADAQVPGPPNPEKELNPQPPDKMLHVEMRQEDKFTLIWKQGPTVVNSIDVPRHGVDIVEGNITTTRYPDLATKINDEWKANGSHRGASDKKTDQAVLHTANKTLFPEIVSVIAPIYTPKPQLAGPSPSHPPTHLP